MDTLEKRKISFQRPATRWGNSRAFASFVSPTGSSTLGFPNTLLWLVAPLPFTLLLILKISSEPTPVQTPSTRDHPYFWKNIFRVDVPNRRPPNLIRATSHGIHFRCHDPEKKGSWSLSTLVGSDSNLRSVQRD